MYLCVWRVSWSIHTRGFRVDLPHNISVKFLNNKQMLGISVNYFIFECLNFILIKLRWNNWLKDCTLMFKDWSVAKYKLPLFYIILISNWKFRLVWLCTYFFVCISVHKLCKCTYVDSPCIYLCVCMCKSHSLYVPLTVHYILLLLLVPTTVALVHDINI